MFEERLKQKLLENSKRISVLLDFMQQCTIGADFHGVSDGANDVRELEAQNELIEDILRGKYDRRPEV